MTLKYQNWHFYLEFGNNGGGPGSRCYPPGSPSCRNSGGGGGGVGGGPGRRCDWDDPECYPPYKQHNGGNGNGMQTGSGGNDHGMNTGNGGYNRAWPPPPPHTVYGRWNFFMCSKWITLQSKITFFKNDGINNVEAFPSC